MQRPGGRAPRCWRAWARRPGGAVRGGHAGRLDRAAQPDVLVKGADYTMTRSSAPTSCRRRAAGDAVDLVRRPFDHAADRQRLLGGARSRQGPRVIAFVTGGAGFIGSNVVAGAGRARPHRRRGLRPAAPGRARQWLNIAKHMFRDFVAPEDMFGWPGEALARRRGDHPYGRHLRDHGDRRRQDRPHQLHVLAATCSAGAPQHGGRWSTPRRRRPTATAAKASTTAFARGAGGAQAAQPYGWSQGTSSTCLAERAELRPGAAAAVGGPEVLQRLRPERGAQGRHDERGSPDLADTVASGGEVKLFKSHRNDLSTAARSATSSMSTTWSR